jgi:hypothetical protein
MFIGLPPVLFRLYEEWTFECSFLRCIIGDKLLNELLADNKIDEELVGPVIMPKDGVPFKIVPDVLVEVVVVVVCVVLVIWR